MGNTLVLRLGTVRRGEPPNVGSLRGNLCGITENVECLAWMSVAFTGCFHTGGGLTWLGREQTCFWSKS